MSCSIPPWLDESILRTARVSLLLLDGWEKKWVGVEAGKELGLGFRELLGFGKVPRIGYM